MKNILILILVMFVLSSCGVTINKDADETCSKIIKEEQVHLDRYITIKKHCKDTIIVEYVNEIITHLKIDAYKTSGVLTSINCNRMPLDKSRKLLKIYIDSCENNCK